MINKITILLTIILLLTNCSVKKKWATLFKDGYTEQKSFKVNIPFEYRLGLVIIKVELNNQTYDFVLDSGATNVLSKDLAKTLNSQELITVNNKDVQGNLQPMMFTKIEEVTIGGIKFEDTGAGIGDFNQSVEVGCLEIDGIIGSNLMRLAIWKIDYRNQIITISNTMESFSLGADTKKIPFYTYGEEDKPFCNIKINGVEEKNVTLDLGSNGDFSLSYKTYEMIQDKISKNKKVMQIGNVGSGFHGYGKIDSSYYLQTAKLSVGNIDLNDQIVKFSKSSTSTIGTAFYKNFDLIMNWKDKELLLSPHTNYENNKFIQKGISWNFRDGALKISALLKESEADKLGIQLGDRIIEIDGKDYSNISKEDYCILLAQKNKTMKHLLINRNGEQLSFDLKNNFIIE